MRLQNYSAVAMLLGAALPLNSQQPAQQPPISFEVTSVKPTEAAPGAGGGIRPTAGYQGYQARNVNVRTLVFIAFSVTDRQLAGAPAWFDTERYDIDAKAEKPGTVDELHRMLQSLLADRFKMKWHRETKELPVYSVSIDKSGLKLVEHDENDKNYNPIQPGGPGKISGNNVAMFSLCLSLSNFLDRNIIDKTGLTKHYDFKLEFTPDIPRNPDNPNAVAAAGAGDAPPLIQAVREQLGLRLTGEKGPVNVLVVDSAEKASAN